MTVIQHIRPSERTSSTYANTRPQFDNDETESLGYHLKQCHRKNHLDMLVHSFNMAHGFMAARIITSVVCFYFLAFALFWLLS